MSELFSPQYFCFKNNACGAFSKCIKYSNGFELIAYQTDDIPPSSLLLGVAYDFLILIVAEV